MHITPSRGKRACCGRSQSSFSRLPGARSLRPPSARSPQLGAGIGSRETRRQARPVASSGATGSAGPRDETPGPRPLRQRGGRRRRWLLRHASGSPVRLHVTADRAASKHIGDSRNPGKAGPPADPARAPDGRRCRGARDWRDARRTSSTVSRPALVSGAYTRSGRGRRDSTVPRAVDRAWRRQRRGNRGCLRRRRSRSDGSAFAP